MEQSNDGIPEEPDESANAEAVNTAPETASTSRNNSANLFESPPRAGLSTRTVNMDIDLDRIQQGLCPPIIQLNNRQMQLTIEIRSQAINPSTGSESDTEHTGIEPEPVPEPAAELEPETAPQRDSSDLRDDQPIVVNSDSSPNRGTPRRKKRKITTPPKQIDTPPGKRDRDDDGLLCSICLDEWTMTGEHRIVSLKCGHLFGQSCIKRWLQDKTFGNRGCATCKARATTRDLRPIYAASVKALDNTREEELRQELTDLRRHVTEVILKLAKAEAQLASQSVLTESYKRKLAAITGGSRIPTFNGEPEGSNIRQTYKLLLEKNIAVSREPCCRVLSYAAKHKVLLISQKSSQSLFPGCAVRMLHVPEYSFSTSPASVVVPGKCVRDITVDETGDTFTCASMSKTVKVFSISSRNTVATLTPNENSILWSCEFDKRRENILYLGSPRSVYTYDLRQPNQFLKEHFVGVEEQDLTAVIKICSVKPTASILFGGFLVCKLKSVWFYEYNQAHEIEEHLLNITGVFCGMSYNPVSEFILLNIRPTDSAPSKILLAKLAKVNNVFMLQIKHTFEGSRVQTFMYRSAQVYMNETDTVVASYLEDRQVLSTWCTNSDRPWLQQLPMGDGVLDLCPFSSSDHKTYMAALSESRCRIFRLNVE